MRPSLFSTACTADPGRMATNLFGEDDEYVEPDPVRVRKARRKANVLRMSVRKEHANFVLVDYEGP